MKIKTLNIFRYTDYQKYLNDVFSHRKREDKLFTYGKWAKEIGISSMSGLTMVLKGQREAGKQLQIKLIKNLDLCPEEGECGRGLHQSCNARGSSGPNDRPD